MSRLGRLFEKFRPAQSGQNEPAAARTQARWIVVGLGNPGEQYRRSRHNAGFMIAQRLAAMNGMELNRRKFNGLYTEVRTPDAGAALIVIPQTFYNRSGECVAAISGYFKVPAEQVIVVHDEMDLAAGQIRIKQGGSDAGNRGVRSIAEALGTPDFIRVRIGIGHPEGAGDSINHVLKPLAADELRAFEAVFDRAADAVVAIMRDGLERAMNVYNQRV
jgi:PTH1 family peptidyl-tRNA hydrolase